MNWKKSLVILGGCLVSNAFGQEAMNINMDELRAGERFFSQMSRQFTHNGDGTDWIETDDDKKILKLRATAGDALATVVIQSRDGFFGPFSGNVHTQIDIRPGEGKHLVIFYESREAWMNRAILQFDPAKGNKIIASGEGASVVVGNYEIGRWYRVNFSIRIGEDGKPPAVYDVTVTDLSENLIVGNAADLKLPGNPESISGGAIQTSVLEGGMDAEADFANWEIK